MRKEEWMVGADWLMERSVPEAIREDVVWKLKVYRLTLFAVDFGGGEM